MGREFVHNRDVCYQVILFFFSLRSTKRMGMGFLISGDCRLVRV